tara:strand:+ start:612 stop:1076 length:465 start_codon:yes stop_codon:yes gene_type:complete
MKLLYRFYDYLSRQKNWLKNCINYKKVLEETYDVGYDPILMFMREHLLRLLLKMGEETSMQEIDETRNPKEQDIMRLMVLLDNKLQDNFADRCGYDNNYEIKVDDDGEYYLCSSNITEEQKENNTQALEKSSKLEEKEWKEIIKLLKNMRQWWV